MRKAQSAGKEERTDALEGKAEVRGEPVSCSAHVLGDWLVLTGSQKKPRGLAAIECCFPPTTLPRLGTWRCEEKLKDTNLFHFPKVFH